jgi:tRNA-dihydrouridine synthase B
MLGLFSSSYPLLLAPMAGYTDPAYRMLCVKYGASGAYTELISATAVIRTNKKTESMLAARGEKYPLGIQLFGSKPEEVARAASIISELTSSGKCDAKFIDLNFGCPVRKVTRTGAGSAMLATPKKAGDIIEKCTKSSPLPITAKIRLGYKEKNYLEVSKIIEQAGASALCIHARTKEQGFGPDYDWNAITEVKNSLSIPVIGNGGIEKPEDVLRMKNQTNCDATMIGRAALGNPLFFLQARKAIEGKEFQETTLAQRKKLFLEYISLAERTSTYGFGYAKAHSIEFAAGFPGAGEVRAKISRAASLDGLKAFFLS